MTPPGSSYRNFLLGRSGTSFEHHDMGAAVTQLQTLARLSATTQANTTSRRGDSAMRLLLSGTTRAGEAITSEAESASDDAIRAGLNVVLGQARAGNRRAYYDAMRTYFVLIHRSLNNEATRAQVPELLQGLRQIAGEYAQFLARSTSLQPEERLRYLFAASGVLRNALGRVQVDEAARNAAGAAEIEALATSLRESYSSATDFYRQHLLAHPNGEAYTGILREIQMREAILSGNTDVARQRALELVQWMTAHPPPAEGAENDRWDHRATRALLEDPDFTGLVRGIDTPSSHENTVALLNGVSLELVQTVCASIDHVNEESEATITARYRALSSVAAILSLTRPSLTLAQLLTALADPNQAEAIRQELDNAAHDSAEVRRMLTEAQGDTPLSQWIERARNAARHIEGLRTGAGRTLLASILDDNRRQNPIASLAESLRSHPGLLRTLGMDTSQLRDEAALHRMATELFRRGPLGISVVEEYGSAHLDEGLQSVLHQLRAESSPAQEIGEHLQTILGDYQHNLNSRPDHELAAVHSVLQLIAQTQEVSEGVRVPGEVSNQARGLVNEIEGYWFRTRRVVSHLTSGSSLATLGAGIVLAELLPAALITRAGTSGRLAVRGVNLVNAGRLTFAGSALTGIGSGVAMSFIGTGLHTIDRSRLGLRTHFWRDFGESALTNTLVFGATIPFSHGLARWLTPAAEDGAAIGRLTFGRRVALHTGTALFGGTMTLGAGTIWRRLHTGHWSAPSYEEVAENYLSILAWETGAAGFRRFRSRIGLRAELEGRAPYEPIVRTPTEVTGRFAAIRNGLNRSLTGVNNFGARRTAAFLNVLFTQLGPARAARINEIAARLVADSPQVTPLRQYFAHQLALQELSAPGSLDTYSESFLEGNRIQVVGRPGSFRVQFVPATNVRVAPEGYTARLVEAIRRNHLENAATTDSDYLPRFLANKTAADVVELRVNPETGRIVAVDTHTFADTQNSITLHASYDPVTRQLRLPPVGNETAPRVLDLSPMITAHESSATPMSWNQRLTDMVRRQTLAPAQVLNLLREALPTRRITVYVDRNNGSLSLSREGLGASVVELTAEYHPANETLTLPSARGNDGATEASDPLVVLDLRTGDVRAASAPDIPFEGGLDRFRHFLSGGSSRRLPEAPEHWTTDVYRRLRNNESRADQLEGFREALSTNTTANPISIPFNLEDGTPLIVRRDPAEPAENPLSDADAEVLTLLSRESGSFVRMQARFDPRTREFVIPGPREGQQDLVLNAETGAFTLRDRPAESAGDGGSANASAREGSRTEGGTSGSVSRDSSAPSSRARRVTRHTLSEAQLRALEPALSEGNGPTNVTVFFGNRSGKTLGISAGHLAATEAPQHVIRNNLPESGRVPRERFALHGTYHRANRRIVLDMPASEGQEAGTVTIDMRSGRIAFEARPASPDGNGGGSPPPTGGTPEGGPTASDGETSAHTSSADSDDAEITAPRAVIDPETTGPQPAIDPTLDVFAPLDIADILDPGDTRLMTRPNAANALREGQDWAMIPGLGEVSAFTEVGLSKHNPPRNEDAYGFGMASDGSLVAVIADGAGGSSTGAAASARAVETILQRGLDPTVTLGTAFRDAHPAILTDLRNAIATARAESGTGSSRSIPRDSFTTATALRVESDGNVEVATIGDSQVWVARPDGSGGYEVHAPYLPASMAGMLRAARSPGATSTVGMNAMSNADPSLLSYLGGNPESPPPMITTEIGASGLPRGIFNADLSLPNASDSPFRTPFFAQPGDLFLLMSDGVHTLFSREQMAQTLRGASGAEPARRAIQNETLSTIDLYRNLAQGLGETQRVPIANGRFAGNYIDAAGRIYDAPTDGNLVGNASPDNVALVVVHFNPAIEGASSEGGSH